MKVNYANPFAYTTALQSQAWYDLRKEFLSYKVELAIGNEEVALGVIERNPNDGGRWRWDTPLFDREVEELMSRIVKSERFEAVWLRKENGKYSVLDGHHRLVAWQKLGNTKVPAVVVHVTPFRSAV
jgi:hypothetical protein